MTVFAAISGFLASFVIFGCCILIILGIATDEPGITVLAVITCAMAGVQAVLAHDQMLTLAIICLVIEMILIASMVWRYLKA